MNNMHVCFKNMELKFDYIKMWKSMKVRALKSDDKFLENMPQELMDELINLREPIPMRIRVMVMDYCPNFNRKRSDVIGEDEKLIKDIRQERVVARSLEGVKAREYHNNLAFEFIEKHPQFAPIIKEIKYIDI